MKIIIVKMHYSRFNLVRTWISICHSPKWFVPHVITCPSFIAVYPLNLTIALWRNLPYYVSTVFCQYGWLAHPNGSFPRWSRVRPSSVHRLPPTRPRCWWECRSRIELNDSALVKSTNNYFPLSLFFCRIVLKRHTTIKFNCMKMIFLHRTVFRRSFYENNLTK